jgi:hypothetical protein
MKHMINGKLFELPTEPDGSVDSDVVRKAAGIPDDRPLILQMPDGKNRMVNAGEHVLLRPGEAIIDAPEHVRGDHSLGRRSILFRRDASIPLTGVGGHPRSL